jgi:cytochrome c553
MEIGSKLASPAPPGTRHGIGGALEGVRDPRLLMRDAPVYTPTLAAGGCMQRRMLVPITLTLALATGAVARGETDPQVHARSLAATCAACHGTSGMSSAGMARLAGMPRDELRRTLQDFRTGARPGTVMPQLMKGYTDAQIDAIAAWFEAQSAR